VSLEDKRKGLTKAITYTCTNKNALDAILEILQTCYPAIQYTGVFFNITAWELAKANVQNVSINKTDSEPAINTIEEICASVFGMFEITKDNLFSFRIIDQYQSASVEIPPIDVLNKYMITYDPNEVISSAKVIYNLKASSYVNTTKEAEVFAKYKTYNQRDFNTWLVTSAASSIFSTKVLEYVKSIHGKFSIQVPLKYHNIEVGTMVNHTIARQNTNMITNEKKCEVLGVNMSLSGVPLLTLDMQIIKDIDAYLVTESGDYLITEDGNYYFVV
jgi:hypothetical protein